MLYRAAADAWVCNVVVFVWCADGSGQGMLGSADEDLGGAASSVPLKDPPSAGCVLDGSAAVAMVRLCGEQRQREGYKTARTGLESCKGRALEIQAAEADARSLWGAGHG